MTGAAAAANFFPLTADLGPLAVRSRRYLEVRR